MGLLRSEAMKYGMVVLPSGSDAKQIVEVIGKETAIQFEDYSGNQHKKPYTKQIQRIDELERLVKFFNGEINALGLNGSVEKHHVDEFLADADMTIEKVEKELKDTYESFTVLKENNSSMETQKNFALERLEVVKAYEHAAGKASEVGQGLQEPLLDAEILQTVAGIVDLKDQQRFALAVFRATRGNTFVHFQPVEYLIIDPKTGMAGMKSVFAIYFQNNAAGKDKSAMYEKVRKLVSAFNLNTYDWPSSPQDAAATRQLLETMVVEKDKALDFCRRQMEAEVDALVSSSGGTNSKIENLRLFCIKEKAIYATLNMAEDTNGATCRLYGWYAAAQEEQIQKVLKSCGKGTAEVFLVPQKNAKSPPTYIRINEFTEPWQEVIDTYGVPRYQEANPALLACTTFPFIFGLMYGDVGHGSMLFCGGLWCIMNAEKLRYSVPALFKAKYMLAQMGFFAVYAGFLYNDFFSIGLEIFPTKFKTQGVLQPDGKSSMYMPNEDLWDPRNEGGEGPYPFGIDWMWVGATNELLFVNSLKMKLSVLFGVIQMVVGVLLRWGNAFYEKNMVDFFCECIPMMVFMLAFFGWMDFMILYKWNYGPETQPSIINSLICMAMGQADTAPLWTDESGGSVAISKNLMLATVASVPFMLIPKPFIQLMQHKSGGGGGHGHGHGEEFEFGEVMIHQVIETIEYVLGTVSHTASYLRIWALSLAHQQLSLVFFQKTIQMGLVMDAGPIVNGIALFLLFGAWFFVTCGVLLGMDVLECFLHTLRLHWVEFQSKFYKADGVKFVPFALKPLLEKEEE